MHAGANPWLAGWAHYILRGAIKASKTQTRKYQRRNLSSLDLPWGRAHRLDRDGTAIQHTIYIIWGRLGRIGAPS